MGKKNDKKDVKIAINLIDSARMAHKNEMQQKKKPSKPRVRVNNEENIGIEKIISDAKRKGKITYGELASKLGNASSEQIDEVFNAFENIGVDVLKDDMEDVEPDAEDLEEVEDISIEDINVQKKQRFPMRKFLEREISF